jgi:RNA polymerase sigma-70 factor (ECF subfamily)
VVAQSALAKERPQPGGNRWQQINPQAVSIRITYGVPLASVPKWVMWMSMMAPDDSLPDGLSDEALLAGMAAGAVAAGTAFVRRHQSRVFGLAWVLVGDPGLAEDLVQESFLRAWLHGASFDARRGSVRSWLSTITRNLAIDTLRMHRAEPVDPDALLAKLTLADGDHSELISRLEDAEQVRAAVRELPAPQRRAIVLAFWFGRTAEEISSMEQIPLGTAKTRIRAAMLQLRSTLAEETRR